MNMATSENDKQPAMNDEHEDDNESGHVENDTATEHPNKRLKSAAWSHSIPIYIDGVRRWAKCKYCKKQLTGRSNDGTTHLKDHYRICLRKNTRDIRQHILVQGQKTIDGKAYMSKYSFDAEVSRDELAKMIIIHDYLLSIVEHYDFRKYTENLQPLFKVPCRNTVKGDIMKRMIVGLLSRLICGLQVTKKKRLHGNHSTLYRWQPEVTKSNYESTLTLDNCSANDAIVEKLLGTLTSLSLILKGRIFHMRCCAHIINLIVQDGFSVIANAIENVRNSVSFWTSSPKRIQDFRLLLGKWNSIYMMLSVALEYREVFNRLSKKDKHYVCLPSEDEWNMASNVCEKLKLFYQVTEKFSAIVLDPRYKLKLIKYFFPKLYGEEARSEIMQIRNIITELFEEYKKKHDDKRGASWKRKCATNVSEGGVSTLSKSTWELDFENMLFEDDGFEKTELDDYLADKLLPKEEGFDILMWWKCNGSKDILSIPISAVASESAFSMSGNKVTKERNRIKPETVGALMCSQSWLRLTPRNRWRKRSGTEDVM
uniref:BED-type domain-containing protein n=1 Tax=Lactuca sativa TaxID=4236 RepID=A0A9R1XMN8_LACSA|nr:hypothetical protein LSAT_V11C300147760 [Lactuca sativa]